MAEATPKVLLVEDNPGDARLIQEALKDAGSRFDLVWARRLQDALPEASDAHVILLDLSLPDSNGLATLRRIHAVAPETPVVILTASRDEEAAFRALRQGAQDYLSKDSVEPSALSRALRFAMERHRGKEDVDTLQRQLAAYDKLASIGTMVASVAHEVNNPLAYIRNSAENSRLAAERALTSPHLDAATRAVLEDLVHSQTLVVEGIERIGTIVRSLKTWARHAPSDHVPASLNDLARQTLLVAGPRLQNVEVNALYEGTRPVLVNPGAISQVILNLVLNAAEAMDAHEGGVLTVRVRETTDASLIEVSDTGPGISEEAAAKLFVPFFTTKSRGTGLGLSVSHSIVAEHGGDITFASQPGKGTTFTIRIPFTSVNKPKP